MKQVLQLIKPFREMRKMAVLSFVLFALIAIPMGMRGQTRESYNITYDYSDLSDMIYGSYADATSYWKVPASADNSAVISVPITNQPESDITVTFRIATFGSGTNPSASNTTITAVGTESNSNWSGSGVSSYPSSSSYVNGVMTITKPQNPTTLEGLDITMGVNSGVKIFRLQSITVSYTYGGGTPQPTTYTVTYDCNGGTTGCPENVTGIEAGEEITLANAPTKTDYDFAGWSDGSNTYNAGASYTVNGNVTMTAQWTEIVSGDEHWVAAELADLTENDVFVIVGNGYAMTNNNGTNAPATSAVTIAGNEITSTVAANIKWTVSGNATDGYTFYPNGSTTTWLYCSTTASTGNNNNMKVGTGNRKVFVLNSNNYLETKDNYTTRYLSIYDNADWRGYINTNLCPAMSFYKKVTGEILPPSITANNVSIAYDATSSEIEYTLNNPVTGGNLSVSENVDWISDVVLSTTESKVTFTTTANEATTSREGIITFTYTYGDNETTITKDVTVTQAAAPVIYTTIPDLFAAATSTETDVLVTFDNWVVSGVANYGKNVFVTDNNGNGFVIYYGTDMSSTFAAGDVLSGTAVSCSLKKYNGFAELLNVTTSDLTITSGGTVTVTDVALADLAGVNTGALLHYDNLTCVLTTNSAGTTTFYNLTDGYTTIQVYNAIYAFGTLVEGKTYNITGVYQQYNNIKEILPRSADDIEEVEVPHEEYTLTVSDLSHVNLFIFGGDESETIISTEGGETTAQVYDGTNVEISVDVDPGYLLQSLVVDGTDVTNQIDNQSDMYVFTMPKHDVTVTATAVEYVPSNWVLTDLANLTAEDIFVIVGTRTDATYGGDYAMPNDNGTSAPAAVSVTVVENTLSGEPADNLKWNLSITEDGYVFHPNGDTEHWLYCTNTNNGVKVGDGSAKHFSMSDGYLTTTETSDQRYIGLYNNQDWRCYTNNTTSNIANQTFAFYKKVTSSVECDKIVLDANNEWERNFDNVTQETPAKGFTDVTMGDCWTWNSLVNLPAGYVDTMPQVFYREAFAHSNAYSLVMWHRGVYAMPELDENIDITQLKMSFNVRQSYPFYTLMVGVMDDPTRPETFKPVAYVDNGTSTASEPFQFDFSKYDGEGHYIAFKNVRPSATSFDGQWNDIHSVNYIDDIKLSLKEEGYCVVGLPYEKNFDETQSTNALTGITPECWEVVEEYVEETPLEKKPMVYYNSAVAHSGNYSLRMANRCVYALPALAANVNEVQLSMSVLQPKTRYQLEVGVWDTLNKEFIPVTLVNNATTGYEDIVCDFSAYQGPAGRIALRNVLGAGYDYDYSYNYIDDINVSYKQECNDFIVLGHTETFDGYTQSTNTLTGDKPDCWELVYSDVELMPNNMKPQLYYSDGDYSLVMLYRGVYAMPSLDPDVNIRDLHLSMNLRQTNKAYMLEVGVWEPGVESESAAFVPVHTFNNTNTEETFVECDFSSYEGNGGRIAFRNTLNKGRTWNYSYNYIDDVTLDYYNAPEARNNASSAGVIDEIGVERYLEGISVYPNPTTGVLHIGATDVQKVECYNQMGQLVAVYDNENNISINSLADGVYTLRITVPQGVTMRKVVKR